MQDTISQTELSQHMASGDTILVKYRKAFGLHYSKAQEAFYLTPIAGQATGLPYTKRGRYSFVSPELFRKLQLA